MRLIGTAKERACPVMYHTIKLDTLTFYDTFIPEKMLLSFMEHHNNQALKLTAIKGQGLRSFGHLVLKSHLPSHDHFPQIHTRSFEAFQGIKNITCLEYEMQCLETSETTQWHSLSILKE